MLTILTVLSFTPQYKRTAGRKRSSGLSTYYVPLNLISATEQFALAFCYIVNHVDEPDFFVHEPVNAGDWINLTQRTVVMVLWLVL